MGPETAAAYATGNGSVVLRATAHIEHDGGTKRSKKRQTAGQEPLKEAAAEAADGEVATDVAAAGGKALIVFTEMPYQVCKVCKQRLASIAAALLTYWKEAGHEEVVATRYTAATAGMGM